MLNLINEMFGGIRHDIEGSHEHLLGSSKRICSMIKEQSAITALQVAKEKNIEKGILIEAHLDFLDTDKDMTEDQIALLTDYSRAYERYQCGFEWMTREELRELKKRTDSKIKHLTTEIASIKHMN